MVNTHSKNIALLTFGDDNVKEWNSISFPNKQQYCQLNGYTCITETIATTSRHPAWAKIDLLLKYIDDYDWIFWSDTDSLIMNFDFKLENLIYKNKNLILCESGGTICTGEFFIRRCDWSRKFLSEVNKYDFHDYPWEQAAFEKVLKEDNSTRYFANMPLSRLGMAYKAFSALLSTPLFCTKWLRGLTRLF